MTSVHPPDEGNGETRHVSAGHPPCFQPTVRIGVTGHRDLADRERASVAATEALSRLLATVETAKWPTGMMPWSASPGEKVGYRVVSPLAEGADRVVAALVRSSDARLSDRVRELVVPLPFGIDGYRGRDGEWGTDCKSEQSQAEFDHLRSAALWIEPLHPDMPANDAQRDAWYRDVGNYVIRHCDFLFALWDGRDNKLTAGTAAVVKLAFEHGTPVIWIPVERQAATEPAGPGKADYEPRLLTALPSEDGDRAATGDALSSAEAKAPIAGDRGARQLASGLMLERFGRLTELCRYAQRDGRMPQAIAREMAAAAPGSYADVPALRAVADWIIPLYVAADGMARHYQRLLKAFNIGVYAAAAAAVALGAFAAIVFPGEGNWQVLVVLEALVLVALYLVQVLDIRKNCRDRWVTFRAMSEYFRIGRFLALVSPPGDHGLEFDRFTRLYSWSSEPYLTPWFAPVIERTWECRPDLKLQDSDVPWLSAYLSEHWIGGQITYHESRRKTHLHWDKVFNRTIQLILLITILAVVIHVVLDNTLPARHAGHFWDKTVFTFAFLSIALTSLAAAFNGYSGLQRHSYHAARSSHMEKELNEVKISLCGVTTMAQLQDRLSDARRIMIGEATDWYEVMEQQLIESPA